MTQSYPPALRCLYEELAEHGVDEIWEALNDLGKLEEFLDAANETEKDDGTHNDGSSLDSTAHSDAGEAL